MERNRLKKILVVSSITILAFSVGLYFYIESGRFEIRNYDKYIKNLSKEYKTNITNALYKFVEYNTKKGIGGRETGKALVREGLVRQDETEKNARYSGSFVVDLEKIQQSYLIRYEYSSDPGKPVGSGYPILVSCVDKSDVIYPDFACKDLLADTTPQEDDALLKKLPYKSVSFKLYGFTDDTGNKKIVAQIFETVTTPSSRKRFDVRKKEVLKWIASQGFDTKDYSIEWRDTFNKIVPDGLGSGYVGD